VPSLTTRSRVRLWKGQAFPRGDGRQGLRWARVAKEFLDRELAKYKSWTEARAYKFIGSLFDNAGNFMQSKTRGVGQTILLKFFGSNWKIKNPEVIRLRVMVAQGQG